MAEKPADGLGVGQMVHLHDGRTRMCTGGEGQVRGRQAGPMLPSPRPSLDRLPPLPHLFLSELEGKFLRQANKGFPTIQQENRRTGLPHVLPRVLIMFGARKQKVGSPSLNGGSKSCLDAHWLVDLSPAQAFYTGCSVPDCLDVSLLCSIGVYIKCATRFIPKGLMLSSINQILLKNRQRRLYAPKVSYKKRDRVVSATV